MLRRRILHFFCKKSSILILVGMNLLGCAGTTTVQRQHHLLSEDSSTVSVYFLWPKEGLGGGWAAPIEINLDGENLLDLSVGQYTLLDIKPGKYEMVITSWTDGPKDMDVATNIPPPRVQTSRNFMLDLGEADSMYLLFSLEKIDYWDNLFKEFGEKIFNTTITIPLGEHVTMRFSNESKPQPGIGYTVKSVSRVTAIGIASNLEPVEGAQNSPLHK